MPPATRAVASRNGDKAQLFAHSNHVANAHGSYQSLLEDEEVDAIYLAHALNEASFGELELIVAADRLWAVVGFVVLASIVLHGTTASPVMNIVDRRRSARRGERVPADAASD